MHRRSVTVFLFVFTLTILAAAGGFAPLAQKAKVAVSPAMFEGKSETEAVSALLGAGEVFAATGSWENIHVGRVYYLSGDKDKAEAIFERYTKGAKVLASDLIRIGRVYAQAGEWEKAKPLFDRVVELKPKDSDWLVEIGAYYNLNGDRARAEELFKSGFAVSPKSLRNTLAAAGSYAGVEPRHR